MGKHGVGFVAQMDACAYKEYHNHFHNMLPNLYLFFFIDTTCSARLTHMAFPPPQPN